jgi:hypothetical protein
MGRVYTLAAAQELGVWRQGRHKQGEEQDEPVTLVIVGTWLCRMGVANGNQANSSVLALGFGCSTSEQGEEPLGQAHHIICKKK